MILGASAGLRAAPGEDPAAIVHQLVDELDLQTRLPGEVDAETKKDDAPSGANLKIPGATTILYIAIAVAAALVLLALKDYLPGASRRDRSKTETERAQTTATAERMVQAGDEADELAALGRFGEAMHLLLLRSLVELRRRLGISFADSLTSREILQRLNLPDEGRQALGDLIRRVEFAHFGARPSAPQDYSACRASYERLIAAMLDPRQPSAIAA